MPAVSSCGRAGGGGGVGVVCVCRVGDWVMGMGQAVAFRISACCMAQRNLRRLSSSYGAMCVFVSKALRDTRRLRSRRHRQLRLSTSGTVGTVVE